MLTAKLTGALLDYWVARAEGHAAEHLEIRQVPRTDNSICVRTVPSLIAVPCVALEVMAYSTNWAQGGPLIDRGLVGSLSGHCDYNGTERPYWCANHEDSGHTPLIAICRAVVRAAFGDEVEDLPCV